MPSVKAIHFNPPDTQGRTACGRELGKVTWRTDPHTPDITCNACLRIIQKKEAE